MPTVLTQPQSLKIASKQPAVCHNLGLDSSEDQYEKGLLPEAVQSLPQFLDMANASQAQSISKGHQYRLDPSVTASLIECLDYLRHHTPQTPAEKAKEFLCGSPQADKAPDSA